MRFVPLAITAAVLLSASLIAHADTVSPNFYGGTVVDSTGKTISGTDGTISYTDTVYVGDSNNPYCATCLDFVLQVDDSSDAYGVFSVSTTGFADKYSLSYAYEATDGDVAPTDVSKSAGQVTFSFDDGFVDNDSDALIIYTNAQADASGGLTIDSDSVDPPAFKPSGAPYTSVAPTPEPSSLILLGTGLLGVAGFVRRRLS